MQNFQIDKKELSEILNDLSKIAEPSFQEFLTTEYIVKFLKEHNIPIDKTFKTGCFGTINVGADKTIALRADIDALPVNEEKTCFAHLCGHHGHTASLLYSLKEIIKLKHELKNNFRYIFQPAEETGEGALFMIENGALEGVDEIYSLHGDPNYPVNTVVIKIGELMAGASLFKLIFRGNNTHAAFPHKGSDVVVALADYINICQKIISRFKDPVKEGLISFCKINGGSAPNILPSEISAEGTIRFFNKEMRDFLVKKMNIAKSSIEKFYNVQIEYNFSKGTLPLINDENLGEKLFKILSESDLNVISDDYKMMGSEDFSYFMEKVPGFYIKAGIALDKDHPPLHNKKFFLPDKAVENFVKIFMLISLKN
jgi:amidohydrolase